MSRSLRSVHLAAAAAPAIVAESGRMRELLAEAARVASGDAKILISGESGVGKDLLARYVHAHSSRRHHAYVAVNCAGIAETLLETELFGHVRGSFTGAYRDKVGLLQQADGGTLFLDEIGEMSLRMQAMLLRFLETGEVQLVGAEGPKVHVDVRLIAATNRNLPERVAAGEFREDLLYRICVVHLRVPALRERREDMGPLVQQLASRHRHQVTFTDEALKVLRAYRWPGNIRELQNVVEQISCGLTVDVADVEHLPERIRAAAAQAVVPQRDRRRQVADRLFEEIMAGRMSFWDDVHRLFLERDITRNDLRGLISRGLSTTRGNYRALLRLFHLPPEDYKKLLNFLAAHDCQVAVQPYRMGLTDSSIATSPLAGFGEPVKLREP